ncbi:hypothetical protein CTAYLR_005062 [Chrysophaeum taylorii]|uniref:Condensation domain-containing protein n=1 Tax=Chrysophaeum taylorii TaxID=2483200 RepID=A0AAD7XJX6_9STRA|nr:hypothetical protein CTAYLR_005062 [Chrysophaeum taylorii]
MTKRQNRFAWLPVTAIGELVGDVDIAALERSVHAVVMRHEALRSRLVRVGLGDNDSTLFVVDDDKRRFPQLEVREACSAGEARNEVQTFHNEYDNDAFAPLLPVRALLVCYPREVAHHNGVRATNALLYVSTNHAVSDGWSQQLLYNDLVAAYNNDGVFPKDRPKPARRYCEFLAWHNDQVARLADDPKVQAHIRQYAAATRLPSRWPTVCGTDKVVDTLFETGSLLHTDEVAIISAASVAAVKARLRGDVADFGRASLPSVLLAAYVTALGDAQLGRSVVLQYSHTGRIGQPDLAETYGQLATDMNVIVPASAEPEQQQLGAFISRVHNAVVNSLSLGSVVPYSLAYRASDGRHPLPPQFN